MRNSYKTTNTCAKVIEFDLNDNVVSNVKFFGGCPGNLQAIPKLVDGMTVEEIENKIGGINCSGRGTSCADQLSKAVREALESQKQSN